MTTPERPGTTARRSARVIPSLGRRQMLRTAAMDVQAPRTRPARVKVLADPRSEDHRSGLLTAVRCSDNQVPVPRVVGDRDDCREGEA